MENTIENKAKFFAQYFDQYVHCNNRIPDEPFWVTGVTMQELSENDFLRLTSLSDIRDEDAIEVARIENNYDDPLMKGRWLIANMFDKCPDDFHPMFIMETVDYLRSRGYALPWMGVSVEEQIKRGWIKLKTK